MIIILECFCNIFPNAFNVFFRFCLKICILRNCKAIVCIFQSGVGQVVVMNVYDYAKSFIQSPVNNFFYAVQPVSFNCIICAFCNMVVPGYRNTDGNKTSLFNAVEHCFCCCRLSPRIFAANTFCTVCIKRISKVPADFHSFCHINAVFCRNKRCICFCSDCSRFRITLWCFRGSIICTACKQ